MGVKLELGQVWGNPAGHHEVRFRIVGLPRGEYLMPPAYAILAVEVAEVEYLAPARIMGKRSHVARHEFGGSYHLVEPRTYYATAEEAKLSGPVVGWNLRCNRCGTYGATWVGTSWSRPGWGKLALCPDHAREFKEMGRRHDAERADWAKVRFEQDEVNFS